MDLTEYPQGRQAKITPQAFRSCFKCSTNEFAAVTRLMTESGKVRDGSWELDDAYMELHLIRLQARQMADEMLKRR